MIDQTLMQPAANDDRSLSGFQRHRRNKGTSEIDSMPESEVQTSEPARASSIDAKIDKMMNLLLENGREVASIHMKLESLQDDVSNIYQRLEEGGGSGQQTEKSLARQTGKSRSKQISSRQPEEQAHPEQLSRQKSGQRRRSQEDSHRAMEISVPSVMKIWVRSAEVTHPLQTWNRLPARILAN